MRLILIATWGILLLPCLYGWANTSTDSIYYKTLEDRLNEELSTVAPTMVDSIIPDNVSDGSIGGLLDDEMEAVATARQVIDKLKQTGNFIKNFTGDDIVSFPVGIRQEIGNVTYTLAIGSMRIEPTYTQLEVFLEIDGPKLDMPLIFGSPNVKFSRSAGIVGGAQLGLLGDFVIDIVKEKSVVKLRKGTKDIHNNFTGGTYVEIDCYGFKELSIDAQVVFSRDWIKPVNDTGSNRVTGEFSTVIQSWEDILFDISIGNFVVTGLEDVKWRVNKAVFDFSETRNSDYLQFPVHEYHPLIADERWTGFYIDSFLVEIPERLTGSDPITVAANKVVIDDAGFTGKVEIMPVLPLNEGNLDGWAFSIDTFYLSILTGEFEAVRFSGKINVPMFSSTESEQDSISEADCFSYRAFINPGNLYNFTVSNDSTYQVNMWKASAIIEPNSTIDLLYENETFTLTTTLNGSIHVDGEFGTGFNVDIPDIPFNGLQLSNQAPYFQPGEWQFPTSIGAQIGTFEVRVDSITVENGVPDAEGIAAANIRMGLAITFDGALAIDAQGGILVKGQLHQTNDRQRWKLKGFGVNDVNIDASFSGMARLHGGLNFYEEHPNYGTGFRGVVEAEFKGIGAKISAIGQFGSKDGQRYFMVDALAELGTGIPLGGLSLKGFGGGIYRYMSREDDVDQAFAQLVGGDINVLGAGLSGITYNFNPNTWLGLKATVILSTTDGDAFNANLTFGMEFGTTEGTGSINLSRIWFEGVGKFMAPIDAGQVPSFPAGIDEPIDANSDPSDSPLSQGPDAGTINAEFRAFVLIDLNFQENIYNSRMQVNVEVGDYLTGSAWAASYLNLNEGKWWLYIGQPEPVEKRNTLTLQISALTANLRSYFAVGNHNIPEIPDPYLPGFEDVFAGLSAYTGARPPTSNLEEGKGIIFGSSFDFSVGTQDDPIRFLFFYGYFMGGFGFDLGLTKKQGECTNSIGIDGWYATGQAWAGFETKVWAKIKLFFIEKDFEIFYTRLAAGVRMELPNPFWSRVVVDHQLRVLGIIEVEGNFTFEIGERWTDVLPEDCSIEEGDPVADIQIIESIEVEGGLTESVPVESDILVNLAIPNQEVLTFYDDNGAAERYRVKLVGVGLKDQNGNPIVVGATSEEDGFNSDNTIYTRSYINFLPANTTITATATVKLQFLASGSITNSGTIIDAVWEDVVDDEGNPAEEQQSITFTTGKWPDIILDNNVIAAYPVPGQQFFLRDQYEDGYYLDLVANQLYLFQDLPPGYEAKARLLDGAGNQLDMMNITYGTFNTDGTEYSDSTIHGTFITIEKSGLMQLDADQQLAVVITKDPNAPIHPDYGEEQELFSWSFHTSKYNTLEEKLASYNQTNSNFVDGGNEFAQGDQLIATFTVDERFDDFELSGGDHFLPMLSYKVLIDNPNGTCSNALNDWYCTEALLIDQFAYPALPDCAVPVALSPPVDAIKIVQPVAKPKKLKVRYKFAKEVFEHYEIIFSFLEALLDCPNPIPDPNSSSGPLEPRMIMGPGDDDPCTPTWADFFCTGAPYLPLDIQNYAGDDYHIQFKYHLPRRISLSPNSGNEILLIH